MTRLSQLPVELLNILNSEEADKSESRLVCTVRHIAANLDSQTGKWSAQVYDSLRNKCYSFSVGTQRGKELSDEEETQREQCLIESLALRNEHIYKHKYYLSEEEGKNVGLLPAAAHWRLSHGNRFYDETSWFYKQKGTDFSFQGPEKAIIVETRDGRGNLTTHVIAAKIDLMLEENMCQMMEMEKLKLNQLQLSEVIGELSIGFRAAINPYIVNGYHILTVRPNE